MKDYYELHITFIKSTEAEKVSPKGWKYSEIDGDPVLGDGVKGYYTTLLSSETHSLEDAIYFLETQVQELVLKGLKIRRAKVGQVLFDKKYWY